MNVSRILPAAFSALFAPFCLAQEFTDNIVIDQFGYRERAEKIAVVRVPQQGFGAPSAYTPGAEFQLIDEDSGVPAHTGAPAAFRAGQTDAASGDKIWRFDFSNVSAPGRYYVLDKTNNLRSFSFNIADGVYNDALRAAVKMFYYQRAGTAKPAQYAGAEWADALCFEQDKRTRLFSAKNDAATERDLSGGWFDAGDYNKYTKWTADYVAEMLLSFEENPGVFTDDFGIPESGNGVPDILDEAKWGLAWLLKAQNDDGSVLSVQGLAGDYNDGSGSPPSSVSAPSYYGPANATAAFGAVKAFAIAARVFGGRGEAAYAEQLKTAAVKAWNWGAAHPDSMFSNNVSSNGSTGLAAGNQEIIDDEYTTGRKENYAAAAWYLYELTGEDSLLSIVESNLVLFPLFAWSDFMDQYRHSSHMLYMRYLDNPNGSASLKADIRSKLRTAFAKSADFNGAYPADGYRAFIKDYQWGSNGVKANYGLTFYKWGAVDPGADYRDIAEGYMHYIHGVNPLNTVYLTNMNRYGASRSLTTIYHTWFAEGTKWSAISADNPGPAPGYMPGGPNSGFAWDNCCNSDCGWEGNNARCHLITLPKGEPPAKMYIETNYGWPLNSWEITEPSNGYQLSYIRLLSKFASSESGVSIISRRNVGAKVGVQRYRRIRGGVELSVKSSADVRIFSLNGAQIDRRGFTGGVHRVSLKKLPKGVYIVRMSVDGERMAARVPMP